MSSPAIRAALGAGPWKSLLVRVTRDPDMCAYVRKLLTG
jgi:hypothetical protein